MIRWPPPSRSPRCCNVWRGCPRMSSTRCCWIWCGRTSRPCWATALPEAIDPDKAFQELGFDSLTAVEMRNRLKAATGLPLSPTLIFDYPNSAALAGYFRQELVGASTESTPQAAPGEAEIQRVVASIPVKRLRQAGVLDLLLGLANEADGAGAGRKQGKRHRGNGSRRSGQCCFPRRRRLAG